MTTFVQFESDQKESITGVFSCAQDPEHWPNVSEIAEDDPRYLAFIGSDSPTPEPAEMVERAWRDTELASIVWLRDRHRDQLELGVETTLTADQFEELLTYMQTLRDWPQSEAFPDTSQRPVAPTWIADQTL